MSIDRMKATLLSDALASLLEAQDRITDLAANDSDYFGNSEFSSIEASLTSLIQTVGSELQKALNS